MSEEVRREREAREAAAKAIAETLPEGRYYAADSDVCDEATRDVVFSAASHWDACLIMMAAHERQFAEPDAYGRTGPASDCWVCGASGTEYGETCVTCGGFGYVREEAA